jgi:ribosomal protein L21E
MKKTKVQKVLHEFKTGTLHSGKGGKVVKSRKQAIAIALSEAGKAKKKKK